MDENTIEAYANQHARTSDAVFDYSGPYMGVVCIPAIVLIAVFGEHPVNLAVTWLLAALTIGAGVFGFCRVRLASRRHVVGEAVAALNFLFFIGGASAVESALAWAEKDTWNSVVYMSNNLDAGFGRYLEVDTRAALVAYLAETGQWNLSGLLQRANQSYTSNWGSYEARCSCYQDVVSAIVARRLTPTAADLDLLITHVYNAKVAAVI